MRIRAPGVLPLNAVFYGRRRGCVTSPVHRLLPFLVVVPLLACSDTREKSFPSLTDTEAQGMVARGWIPSGLPATASDVHVRWNIDTNMVRGRLRVQGDDAGVLISSMRSVEDGITPPFWLHGDVTPPWWPGELNPPLESSALRRRGWDLLAVPDASSTFIAIRKADGQLYFWTESS